jgi:hypothetical protein
VAAPKAKKPKVVKPVAKEVVGEAPSWSLESLPVNVKFRAKKDEDEKVISFIMTRAMPEPVLHQHVVRDDIMVDEPIAAEELEGYVIS